MDVRAVSRRLRTPRRPRYRGRTLTLRETFFFFLAFFFFADAFASAENVPRAQLAELHTRLVWHALAWPVRLSRSPAKARRVSNQLMEKMMM